MVGVVPENDRAEARGRHGGRARRVPGKAGFGSFLISTCKSGTAASKGKGKGHSAGFVKRERASKRQSPYLGGRLIQSIRDWRLEWRLETHVPAVEAREAISGVIVNAYFAAVLFFCGDLRLGSLPRARLRFLHLGFFIRRKGLVLNFGHQLTQGH